MPDPLPSLSRPTAAPGAAGEDARIEHLLVTGLDHYFAGEFDAAINLWTRVLFLDRTHDRARAYIERARSAQAEQQRQTEALVHEGLNAFDRGEVEQARTLLRQAMERGASHDLALGVLGRIDRLDVSSTPATIARTKRRERARPDVVVDPARSTRPHRGAAPIVALMLLVALGAVGWWTWDADSWTRRLPRAVGTGRASAVVAASPAPLPVAKVAEASLRRGRTLFQSGRLRDALDQLERVPMGDPLRSEADRLRGSIQRELLALALADTLTGLPAARASGERPPE